MSTPSKMCLGCVPIVDNIRTNAYVQWAIQNGSLSDGCCPQVNLGSCVDDAPVTPFTNPVDDEVCWYDPNIPESADFLGLFINNVTGLQDDPYERSVSNIASIGSVFNRPTRSGKTLTFDVVLLATSCCGMDYGRNWLAGVLKGQGCVHGLNAFENPCGTSELRIRVCCPVGGANDAGIRNYPYSSLTQGLARLDGDRKDKCCCTVQRYSFVIQTGTPDGFGDLEEVCDSLVDPTPENSLCIPCRPEIPPDPDPCIDPMDCWFDDIDAFESPSLKIDCGYCPPAEVTRTCCCVGDKMTGSTDRTLVIDLFSGEDPNNVYFTENGARNIEILIWENPMNLPCPESQEDFEHFLYGERPCAEIKIGFIPRNSVLRIDGRTGEAYILCSGRRIPIYDSVEGDLKRLEIGCTPLLVCALWDRVSSVHAGSVVNPTQVASGMTVSTVRKYA